MQLNVSAQPAGGALRFAAGPDRTALLSSALSLTGDISLADLGLTGFTRDNKDDMLSSTSGNESIEPFTGTLNGNGHTIALAIGEGYGVESDGTTPITASGLGKGAIIRTTITVCSPKPTARPFRTSRWAAPCRFSPTGTMSGMSAAYGNPGRRSHTG
jgi:hypothetical protein